MGYRFGIDAGSKTIKAVIVDDDGTIVHSIYRRHRFDIRTTAREVVHDLAWRYGDLEGTIGITGSAGIGLSEVTGLPFVQEVIATTRSVQETYPQADAIIELGGEDAKIVYLTGGLEQRMNATCAGGTGGFIDTIAFMIGARSRDLSAMALRSSRTYPIASRCAVFAQTDVRPLLNAGASTADIAASALDAVVRQTIGGLACGRPIEGTVVFLGGPLNYIHDLVRRFRLALGLTAKTGIKPEDAHLFTALGAAIVASEGKGARTVTLREVERMIADAPNPENDLPRLAPLFDSADEIEPFRTRHAGVGPDRARLFDARGDLYLGIDAGSTAVKLALIDDEGRLVHSDYHATDGDALKTSVDMLEQLYAGMPRTYAGEPLARIAHATATGYGENLLRAALGVDSGVVETTAHTTAALEYVPDLTFLLDIGGQDIKAIWVRDGVIDNAVLNEACSSGCGSLIEGTAHSLGSTPERFAVQALAARSPLDLGTKCTVFMSSRVRHAQKAGASVEDLSAGAAYSVVRNALFRIIGVNSLDTLGNTIVAQGGAFMSDAVLRAFEKLLGREVVRPREARLMGAIGCALVARERAGRARRAAGEAASSLVGPDVLRAFDPKRRSMRCPGCANSCALSITSFGNGRTYIGGNRCDRAEDYVDLGSEAGRVSTSFGLAHERPGAKPPNAVALEEDLLRRFSSKDADGPRGDVFVGIMDTLRMRRFFPFWHTVVSSLGFTTIVPRVEKEAETARLEKGLETIPSESVCYPAKMSHVRLFSLLSSGATSILMPRFLRGRKCPVSCEYVDALKASVPESALQGATFCSPRLLHCTSAGIAESPEDRDALYEALAALAPKSAPIGRDEFDAALRAGIVAQARHDDAIARGNERAIAWAHEPGHHGIVLVGRPCHADPAVLHDIDGMLSDLGFSVVVGDALPPSPKPDGKEADADQPRHPWRASRRLLKAAHAVIEDPALDLVCLQSFGCLYDVLGIADAREAVRAAGRPFTALKIDDIADTAHIRIRLRTLAETIERIDAQGERRAAGEIRGAGSADSVCADVEEARVAAAAPEQAVAAARAGDPSAFSSLEQADVETARMHVNDVCFTVSAIAGRAIRIVASAPDLERIVVPHQCESCVLDGLGSIVERACGRCPEIVWASLGGGQADEGAAATPRSLACAAPVEVAAAGRNAEASALGSGAETRPLIGIVGTEALAFDPFMNGSIVSFLASLGCDVAMPDKAMLETDDVRYLPQLDAFSQTGVDHVIYLVSFGCLKGHISARGALREFGERYPDMPVTVIDYDPEASALNRENRIRLVVEAAREAAANRAQR